MTDLPKRSRKHLVALLMIAFLIALLLNVVIWALMLSGRTSSDVHNALWWLMIRLPYVVCVLPGICALIRRRWIEGVLAVLAGLLLGLLAYAAAALIAWLLPVRLPRP